MDQDDLCTFNRSGGSNVEVYVGGDEKTGELLLRGPSVMKGYHNQPEMTAEVIDEDILWKY